MFNIKRKKEIIKEELSVDKTILDKIITNLEEARKSGSFMVCMSVVYKDDNDEERLRHDIFTVGFKKDDVPISLNAYIEQIKNKENKDIKSSNSDNIKKVTVVDEGSQKDDK